MIRFKKMTAFLIFLFLGTTALFAQLPGQQQTEPAEIGDGEMEQFAAAYMRIQSINQQLQQKMAGAIQEKGMDIQKFNELFTAAQDPEKEADATEDEQKKFEAARQAIQKIQNEAQQDMQKIIEESGLIIPQYQKIMRAVQTQPELQQKLQEHIQAAASAEEE